MFEYRQQNKKELKPVKNNKILPLVNKKGRHNKIDVINKYCDKQIRK